MKAINMEMETLREFMAAATLRDSSVSSSLANLVGPDDVARLQTALDTEKRNSQTLQRKYDYSVLCFWPTRLLARLKNAFGVRRHQEPRGDKFCLVILYDHALLWHPVSYSLFLLFAAVKT